MTEKNKPHGQPLAVDSSATSADPKLPGFLARPADAPVYHGFRVLADVSVEGFTFGTITDFESKPSSSGDAFVIAPDNSRAGLVWKVHETPLFEQISGLEPARWGVWAVNFPFPMNSHENVRKNLETILPQLREKWQQWLSTES